MSVVLLEYRFSFGDNALSEHRLVNLVWTVALEQPFPMRHFSVVGETVCDQWDVCFSSGGFHHLRPRVFDWEIWGGGLPVGEVGAEAFLRDLGKVCLDGRVADSI